MRIKTVFLTCIVLGFGSFLQAQNNLLDLLNQENPEQDYPISATFKGTRIQIGHSVETRKSRTLEISAHSRFWNTPEDASQSFVADRANTRFALEYGVSDNFTLGTGTSTFDGFFDVYAKYRILHQTKKEKNPISITLFQNATYRSREFKLIPRDEFIDRFSFTSQVLIARKVTRNFSLQLAPSYVHHGAVGAPGEPLNQFAVGFGARYKIGGHLSVASEYYLLANEIETETGFGPSFNAFSIGVNWELSDLFLQFMLTNSRYLTDDSIITQNRFNFNFRNPNLHFGFNATYIIHFKKKERL